MAMLDVPSHVLPLYRVEAIKARQYKIYGEIILIRPLSMTISLGLASLVLLCSLAYLCTGRYAEKAQLMGSLIPDADVVTVYAPESARVTNTYVHPGQIVTVGEALFALTEERSGASGDVSLETEAKNRMTSRLGDLRQERDELVATSRTQTGDMAEHEAAAQHQQAEIAEELLSAKARGELARQRAVMQDSLYSEHLISQAALLDSKTDVFDQERALHELQRSNVQLDADLHKIHADLTIAPLTLRTQLAEKDQSIADVEAQLAENGYIRNTVVRATIEGTVSTVLCQPGLQIQPTNAMATLVPKYDRLEARLYAPSKSIGFLRVGDTAMLQYPSFPYEKFGHFPSKVISISSTPLSPLEYTFRTGLSTPEPMYEVVAVLPSQQITAAEERHTLQPGMTAEADIVLDSRTLMEWILRPFLGLRRSALS